MAQYLSRSGASRVMAAFLRAGTRLVARCLGEALLYVVFWMFAYLVLRPQTAALPLALAVFLATCGIEFSQAWHPAWLDRLRTTLPGRLVLGTTFDWSDFPPYAAGAAIGWAIIRAQEQRKP